MVRNGFKKCVGQCSLPEGDFWSWAMEPFRRWYCIALTPPAIWRVLRDVDRNDAVRRPVARAQWGRIGTWGRYKIELFEDEAAAETAMARLAGIKSGRGYLRVPNLY
jgi:predicted DNA-binding WGR domain protein